MTGLAMLFWCIVAHVLWLHASPSAWLVPNLTLLGLVLTVTAKPERWFACSLLAAGAMTLWSIRWLPTLFLAGVGLGWSVRQVTRHWDARDVRVQLLLVALGSATMTFGSLYLDQLFSVAAWVSATLHVAITLLMFPIAKALLNADPRRWSGNGARSFVGRRHVRTTSPQG